MKKTVYYLFSINIVNSKLIDVSIYFLINYRDLEDF